MGPLRRSLPAAALLLAGALAPAAQAGEWSAPRDVTASGRSLAPSVALAPDAGYVVAYIRDLADSDRPEIRQGRGATLRAPVLLDTTARRADQTAVAVDDARRVVAVWRRHVDVNYRLWSAHVSTSGRVTPTHLTGSGESAYDPSFVPGTTIAAWNRRTSAWLRPSAGGRWGDAVRLPAGAVFGVSLAARADGSLVAVWPDGPRIMTAERPAGSGAFGTPQVLSTTGYARAPQVVALDDGTTVAVWTRSLGAGNELVAAARPAGGGWGAPVAVAPAAEGVFDPRAIATTNGQVVVSYVGSGSSRTSGTAFGALRLVRLGPDARVLAPPVTLSGSGVRVGPATLSRDASAAWVAWSEGSSIVTRRITAGGGVGRRRVLSGGDRVGRWAQPAVAMARNGRAVLAYETVDGLIRLVTKPAGL